MNKAKQGIWMPTARVLCYECHGPIFPRYKKVDGEYKSVEESILATDWLTFTSEQPLGPQEALTYCDSCGQTIKLYDSVAMEHELAKKLRDTGIDACMEQTGGMNSACCVLRQHEGEIPEGCTEPYYYVTYSFDGDNKFWLGAYDMHNDWDDQSPVNDVSFDRLDDVFEYVKNLPDVKRLEAN